MLAPELGDATWRKSSHSGESGDCIETATLADSNHAVRDSKNKCGPALIFSAEAWASFLAHVKGVGFSDA